MVWGNWINGWPCSPTSRGRAGSGPGHSDELGPLGGVVLLAGDDVDGHGPLVLRGDSGSDLDSGELPRHSGSGPPRHCGGDVGDLGPFHNGLLGERVDVDMMTHIELMSENSPLPTLARQKTISAPNNFLLSISWILTRVSSLVLIFCSNNSDS